MASSSARNLTFHSVKSLMMMMMMMIVITMIVMMTTHFIDLLITMMIVRMILVIIKMIIIFVPLYHLISNHLLCFSPFYRQARSARPSPHHGLHLQICQPILDGLTGQPQLTHQPLHHPHKVRKSQPVSLKVVLHYKMALLSYISRTDRHTHTLASPDT